VGRTAGQRRAASPKTGFGGRGGGGGARGEEAMTSASLSAENSCSLAERIKCEKMNTFSFVLNFFLEKVW